MAKHVILLNFILILFICTKTEAVPLLEEPTDQVSSATDSVTPSANAVIRSENDVPVSENVVSSVDAITPTENANPPPSVDSLTSAENVVQIDSVTLSENSVLSSVDPLIPTENEVSATADTVTPTENAIPSSVVPLTPTENMVSTSADAVTPIEDSGTPTENAISSSVDSENEVSDSAVAETSTEDSGNTISPSVDLLTSPENSDLATTNAISPSENWISSSVDSLTATENVVSESADLLISSVNSISSSKDSMIPSADVTAPPKEAVLPIVEPLSSDTAVPSREPNEVVKYPDRLSVELIRPSISHKLMMATSPTDPFILVDMILKLPLTLKIPIPINVYPITPINHPTKPTITLDKPYEPAKKKKRLDKMEKYIEKCRIRCKSKYSLRCAWCKSKLMLSSDLEKMSERKSYRPRRLLNRKLKHKSRRKPAKNSDFIIDWFSKDPKQPAPTPKPKPTSIPKPTNPPPPNWGKWQNAVHACNGCDISPNEFYSKKKKRKKLVRNVHARKLLFPLNKRRRSLLYYFLYLPRIQS